MQEIPHHPIKNEKKMSMAEKRKDMRIKQVNTYVSGLIENCPAILDFVKAEDYDLPDYDLPVEDLESALREIMSNWKDKYEQARTRTT
jgi:hypothetical protein